MPDLNDKQREAVEATEGPVLVIAGAGSGKTRVLTERIAHLVRDRQVSPAHILAFTFTNRAAREMKERLEVAVPGISQRLWVGTFHATGVRILRRHGERVAIDRYFSIYDTTDSQDVIKQILSRQGADGPMIRSPRTVRDRISLWKNDLVTPELAAEQVASPLDRRIVDVFTEYERTLRRSNALDFDDLIAKVVELFATVPEARDHYARRFRYVLVDEFQDTNPIQMAMIEDLASYHQNLFVVGDDDQSIYSWRGARVDHILNFETLYPDTRVIRLEQNYRSTQTILDASNHVIAHNVGRKGKNLWTSGDKGGALVLLHSMDEQSEAMNILSAVRGLVEDRHSLRDIAILYRTNAQSRALEDVLKLGSTPYQIIGSVRFYERAEVRDVMAYCKLLVNPSDDVSLRRILNVPRRGLGKSTLEHLASLAQARGSSMADVLRGGQFELGAAQVKRCAEFLRLVDRLGAMLADHPAPEVVEAIVRDTGYREYLRDNYPDADARLENVDELVAAAEQYAEGAEDPSLAGFLEEIALVADVDALAAEGGELTLMTLHNAKGLEFDCVIIAGMEEGLFPHINSLDNPEALEEERRLFYVGMTRARQRLFCSYANMRRRMGVMEGGNPSRFLFEIPESCLEGAVEHLARAGSGLFDAHETGSGTAYTSGGGGEDFEDYSQEELVYAVGMRIEHNDFGRGVVRRVEGSGEKLRVTVIFDRGGERKFLAFYAPMRPV